MSRWLEPLLGGSPAAAACESVAAWWPRHQALAGRARDDGAFAVTMAGAQAADRLAWAFASAYQSALRVLVPELPDDRVVALCVTEATGNAPRDIQTTLRDDGDRLQLDGAKRWTTLGPDGGLFLVAAREVSASTAERPALRLLQVPAGTAGLHIEPMPPTDFVPEVPHARLRFERLGLDRAALLPGDGYARYVKPFRTVEDLHVHAAALAYLVREARRLAWPAGWIECAVAVLLSFERIAGLPVAAATTHVALAGAMAAGAALVGEADAHWRSHAEDSAAARWRRDRPLLDLAAKARGARAAGAWQRLAAPVP